MATRLAPRQQLKEAQEHQADATPYLGRTCTGRIAPALPGAHRGRDAHC
jgi:hypothetical protein